MLLIRRLLKFYFNYWAIFIIWVPLGIWCFGRPIDANYSTLSELYSLVKRWICDLMGVAGYQSYNVTWWFNKLIIILYLLSPLVYILVKKIPLITFLATICIVSLGLLGQTYALQPYLIAFEMGFLWSLYRHTIDRWVKRIPTWAFVAVMAVGCLGLVVLRCRRFSHTIVGDPYIALAIALLIVSLKPHSVVGNRLLTFLGKHATNIYLTHTFVYLYFWNQQIYSLGNPWLIFATVLAISVVASMMVEWLKAKSHYNTLPDKIANFIATKTAHR